MYMIIHILLPVCLYTHISTLAALHFLMWLQLSSEGQVFIFKHGLQQAPDHQSSCCRPAWVGVVWEMPVLFYRWEGRGDVAQSQNESKVHSTWKHQL